MLNLGGYSSVYSIVYLFLYLLINLFVCLSICFFVCLFVCLLAFLCDLLYGSYLIFSCSTFLPFFFCFATCFLVGFFLCLFLVIHSCFCFLKDAFAHGCTIPPDQICQRHIVFSFRVFRTIHLIFVICICLESLFWVKLWLVAVCSAIAYIHSSPTIPVLSQHVIAVD